LNRHIQCLRGIACGLVVLYHVIGPDPSGGLRISDGILRVLNDNLAYLRMPLFTVLSGLVYGMRPFVRGTDGRRFLLGKARRLLVPMLMVGTSFAVLQAIIPGTNNVVGDWRLLHIVPVGHFWFLESLFWVFVLLWGLERAGWLARPNRYAVVFATAVVIYLTVRAPRVLGLDGAVYLLPYFLGGLAVMRFGVWPRLRTFPVLVILAVVAAAGVWWLGLPLPRNARFELPTLAIGLSLCGLCLAVRLEWAWLARLGTSSYAIYLFHVFFTAGSRITLELLGLAYVPWQIVAGVIAGLTGPMAIEWLAAANRWSALLLLGRRAVRGEASLMPIAMPADVEADRVPPGPYRRDLPERPPSSLPGPGNHRD
jgi:peptidoglycan/LPS O-acetylase OafA/YrhL